MLSSWPPCLKAIASYSTTCWKACFTSPRPTRCCIRERRNFWAQSPSVLASVKAEFGYIKVRHEIVTKRNPYDVLGINASIGNDELKSHYRRLVLENHPDKLIARGVPKEFVAIATEKVSAINEAYGQ